MVLIMAKSANVSVRVEPDIKEQAEFIMEKLGLPVSVVINSLYRQIIMNNGIPFSMSLPKRIPTLEDMSKAEFDNMLETGFNQSESRQGMSLDEAFDRLEKSIK